jgi:hypothetical protein
VCFFINKKNQSNIVGQLTKQCVLLKEILRIFAMVLKWYFPYFDFHSARITDSKSCQIIESVLKYKNALKTILCTKKYLTSHSLKIPIVYMYYFIFLEQDLK